MNVQFPWLTVLTLLPLVAAFFIPVLPDREGKTVRWYALAIALLEFGLSAMVFWQHYDAQSAQIQMVETVPWLPQIGLNWSLAVDGLAVPLMLLTGLVNTVAIFAAWQVKQKPRLFYFLMLALYSAQIGVFAAQDLILFFLIWELELVPVYLLISIWGEPNANTPLQNSSSTLPLVPSLSSLLASGWPSMGGTLRSAWRPWVSRTIPWRWNCWPMVVS